MTTNNAPWWKYHSEDELSRLFDDLCIGELLEEFRMSGSDAATKSKWDHRMKSLAKEWGQQALLERVRSVEDKKKELVAIRQSLQSTTESEPEYLRLNEEAVLLALALDLPTQAEALMRDRLATLKKIHHDNNKHAAVGDALHQLGDFQIQICGKKGAQAALENLLEALGIRQEIHGNSHLAVAETFDSIGYALRIFYFDEYALALDSLEKSLNIKTEILGPEATEVGDTLNMMGAVCNKRGISGEASRYFKEALRIQKLHGTPDKIIEVTRNIGHLNVFKEETATALGYYIDCLMMAKTELGDGHPLLADVLVDIGNAQQEQEVWDEALLSFREALTIRFHLYGMVNNSVVDALFKLGYVEALRAEDERSERIFKACIQIWKEGNMEREMYAASAIIDVLDLIQDDDGPEENQNDYYGKMKQQFEEGEERKNLMERVKKTINPEP